MTRKLVLLVALAIALSTIGNSSPEDWNPDDAEAIRQAALDYVDGWYEGNADRMAAALHPGMIKRQVFQNGSLNNLDYATMVDMTRWGGGKGVAKDKYRIEVKILDIDNNIASAKTVSQYIDYLHLAKINNKWVIVNVLWDMKR